MEESAFASRPAFTWDELSSTVARFGPGLKFSSDLPSERDQNVKLAHSTGPCAVFKINNATEDPGFVQCQNQVLQLAAKAGARCQRLLQTDGGEVVVIMKKSDGPSFLCRMLSYMPGEVLGKAAPLSASDGEARAALWKAVGRAVGSVTASMLNFDHAAAHRDFVWDLQQCERVISAHQGKIRNDSRRGLVGRLLAQYQAEVAPKAAALRRSVVHNDPNDYNLVVDAATGEVGVLDFGDMCYSYTCADAAICAAYLLLHCPADTPIVPSLVPFVQGFHENCALKAEELDVLFDLALMRVCTSVCMSAYQSALEPDNEYLTISESPAWALLERLPAAKPDGEEAPGRILRLACGL